MKNNIFSDSDVDLFFIDFAVEIELQNENKDKIKAQFIEEDRNDLEKYSNFSLTDETSQLIAYIRKKDILNYNIHKNTIFTYEDVKYKIIAIENKIEKICRCIVVEENFNDFEDNE